MRNGWKQRARFAALCFALAALPSLSSATVMEFGETGEVTLRPSINYLQRARLEVPSEHPSGEASSIQYIEQNMNNIRFPNAAEEVTFSQVASVAAPKELPDIDAIPAAAITFVDARIVSPYHDDAIQIAEAQGVPSKLFLALIEAESGFRAKARSPKGALGLTQLMPRTAKGLGVNPHDPFENMMGGARYLRMQFDRFGTWPLALAAYNAGPARVAKTGGIPNFPETKTFVARVMRGAGLATSPILSVSN